MYDVAVIGGGPGGYTAALRAAARGASVCLIEADRLGGTCLNVGCIPVKAMLRGSQLRWLLAQDAVRFGLSGLDERICPEVFRARVRELTDNLRGGLKLLLRARKVELIRGRGSLKDRHEIEVDTDGGRRLIQAATIIIATGSRPNKPAFLPWDGRRVMTTDDAATSVCVPESVVILGAGATGCEFATIYSELGIRTTIVEMQSRLLPLWDPDASHAVERSLERRDVEVVTGTRLGSVEVTASALRINLEGVRPMGYKAFLVAVDREACAFYKRELDKRLPPEYSRVVYSAAQNDTAELAKYHLSENEEKQVRKAFRNPGEQPRILIVTEKLLTGFDAPILYCMYLDKPMRDHVLLQAIARVNRPYEDAEGRKKPSGFVLDFVGIFDNLEKALAFDSADIEGVVHDIQVLKDHFAEMMGEAKEQYLGLIKGKRRDKAVEAVLQHFRDEEPRHEFYRFFRNLSDIYDIISPDAFLRPYIQVRFSQLCGCG